MKNRQRLLLRSMILGLLAGLILLEVKKYFDLPLWTILVFIVAVFAISSLIPFLRIYKKQKQVHNALLESRKILEKENNPREFLRVNEEIYDSCTDDISRLKTLSNMMVGYDRIGEYKAPLKKLNQMKITTFTSGMKEYYFSTKAMLLFKADRSKEAVDLMKENAEWFNRHQEDYSEMGSVFFYDRLMKMIYEKRFKEAKEILDQAQSVMGEDFFQKEYNLVESKLKEQELK